MLQSFAGNIMSPFDKFENDLLFTYREVPVIVSIEDEEIQVRFGNTLVTDDFTPAELAELYDDFMLAAAETHADEEADRGDYLYEQEKDKRLDATWEKQHE